ncbi:hypothetical protein SDC9_184548 [bioreactor metagenome]|uniref:Uncharacterized protein n=1 Tax=bioreactor metagenome TaxID=1076179 RepID=A0A645HF78_9ZZZZ
MVNFSVAGSSFLRSFGLINQLLGSMRKGLHPKRAVQSFSKICKAIFLQHLFVTPTHVADACQDVAAVGIPGFLQGPLHALVVGMRIDAHAGISFFTRFISSPFYDFPKDALTTECTFDRDAMDDRVRIIR